MINYNDIESIFTGVSMFLILVLIVFGVFCLLLYIFGALGIMELAKKNNVPNPWMAFIPVANNYLIGKLGFEIYSDKENKNPTLTWLMLGISAASFVIEPLYDVCTIAILVLATMAYYRIYKYMVPNEVTKYTILSFFFGGCPLYFKKDIIKPKKEEVNKSKEENSKEESSKEENSKKETSKKEMFFCPNCGNKLKDDINFCPKCGNKIN